MSITRMPPAATSHPDNAAAPGTMRVLPTGCGRPDLAELERFETRARQSLGDAAPAGDYQVRWIGLDAATTWQIFDLIRAGDKTGTFTLPWVAERTGAPEPAPGDAIILVDFGGRPRQLVRLTSVELVRFGDITAAHTAIDGSPVRSLVVWKPLHTNYWNAMLDPFGLAVSDAMPVWVEGFELLYDEAG